MSILIRGMEMPTEDDEIIIRIDSSGTVMTEYALPISWAKAVPVPPHGRLGDLDKMKESIRKQTAFLRILGGEFAEIAETLEKGFLQEIDNAPTIIEADPEEEEP